MRDDDGEKALGLLPEWSDRGALYSLFIGLIPATLCQATRL
jgi:hypothetical protein